jgi:hypothetical protein
MSNTDSYENVVSWFLTQESAGVELNPADPFECPPLDELVMLVVNYGAGLVNLVVDSRGRRILLNRLYIRVRVVTPGSNGDDNVPEDSDE